LFKSKIAIQNSKITILSRKAVQCGTIRYKPLNPAKSAARSAEFIPLLASASILIESMVAAHFSTLDARFRAALHPLSEFKRIKATQGGTAAKLAGFQCFKPVCRKPNPNLDCGGNPESFRGLG